MNKEIPCIDCITLSICKSIVKEDPCYISVIQLGRKCELIKNVIDSYVQIINHGSISYGSHRRKPVSKKDVEMARRSYRELVDYLQGEYNGSTTMR